MKKWLAILLSAILLLSGCALAEGARITLGGIQAVANGQMLIDLSGMDFELSVATGDAGAGLRVEILNNGQKVDDVTATLLADGLLLESSGLSDSYSLALGELLGSMDPNALAKNAANFVSQEDGAALSELSATLTGIFRDAVSDADAEVIDGVEYEVKAIEISEEQMDEVFDCLCKMADNHPELLSQLDIESAAELKATLSPQMRVSGKAYSGEKSALLDVSAVLNASMLPAPATLRLYMKGGENGDDGAKLHFELSAAMSENDGSLALDIGFNPESGEWMPGAIPADAVSINALLADSTAAQATLQKVQSEVGALAMRIVSSIMYTAALNAQQG